jgi:outer membrane lipopolysaccharide assembly protein LptE/RlpB
MICHRKYVPFITKIKVRKGVISYLKTNGIVIFKNYVDVEHTLIAKKFEEEVSNPMRSGLEKQLTKKRPNVSTNEIFEIFSTKDHFKKDDV